MEYQCKHAGCTGFVDFEPDDNRYKVPGSLMVEYLNDHTFHLTLKDAIPDHRSMGILKIIQPDHAELKEQTIYFQKDILNIKARTQRFYLTCNNQAEPHTLPYEILVENV